MNLHSMEWVRQVFHVALGLFFVFLIQHFPLEEVLLFCVLLLFVGGIVSALHHAGFGLWFVSMLLKRVQRKEESIQGQGAFFFVLGITLVLLLFHSKTPVLAGIVALAFEDSFSTLVGKRFGMHKVLGEKTGEGFLGGVVAAAFALSLVLPFPFSLGIAVLAGLAEFIPINDALTIPLVTAFAVSIFL
ncbi:MAG: hypothetical protein HY393_01980 [Candidatus Diapherotrites archaeon]|nr:hypothetical protein [Candidatus Diapherotrites archaeon]